MKQASALFALLVVTSLSSNIIIRPSAETQGKDIGLIMIQGAQCTAEAYVPLANAIQAQLTSRGYKAYVGISDFAFDAPDPLQTQLIISSVLSEFKKSGFDGEEYYVSAHSLGGVMAQVSLSVHNPGVKGIILMGSTILRMYREIEESGNTRIKLNIPTLTIGGTNDGLMRISRIAEAFWHHSQNIKESQQHLYPVKALEGVSHNQFASGIPPSNVKQNDLKPDISYTSAHTQIAETVADFMESTHTNQLELFHTKHFEQSRLVVQPMIDALIYEGAYQLKPACYDAKLVNPTVATCAKGSPFVAETVQKAMAGLKEQCPSVSVYTSDNFHRVATVAPVHLPEVDNYCVCDRRCTLNTISVTENAYETLDDFDSGFVPITAYEQRSKLMSRQYIWNATGVQNADFHKLDEEGNRCAEINQMSYDWALNHASQTVRNKYLAKGQKLVMGADLGPYNAGPLWIWNYLTFEDNEDKTVRTVKSPMMRTPIDYSISAAAGFHYCKILSPARAMEWIMVDGLYAHDSIKDDPSHGISQEYTTSINTFLA